MPAGGPAEPAGDATRRRCLVTRQVLPKTALIRFAVAPDGAVLPDLDGKLPGRGLWLAAERAVVERALAKRVLARAAAAVHQGPVQVPADLAERVRAGLERRCLGLLGLARRAGQAVAGFEKVRGWLREGRVAVLLAARDGAADGRARLAAMADGRPVIAAFDAAALGAALGREMAVHVALAPGGLARRLVDEVSRLDGMTAAADHAAAPRPDRHTKGDGAERNDG